MGRPHTYGVGGERRGGPTLMGGEEKGGTDPHLWGRRGQEGMTHTYGAGRGLD